MKVLVRRAGGWWLGGSVKSGYSGAEVFWPVSSSGQGDGQGKSTQRAPVTPTIPSANALQLALNIFSAHIDSSVQNIPVNTCQPKVKVNMY